MTDDSISLEPGQLFVADFGAYAIFVIKVKPHTEVIQLMMGDGARDISLPFRLCYADEQLLCAQHGWQLLA